jgi:cyclomaltodextrinase
LQDFRSGSTIRNGNDSRGESGMKKTLVKWAICLVAGLMILVGCSSPVGPEEQKTGNLTISIAQLAGSRTIIPELSSQVKEVEITIAKGNENQSLTILPGETARFTHLSTGTWVVSAEGKNQNNSVFLTANENVTIKSGSNSKSLELQGRRTGSGVLTLDYLLPTGHAVDTVAARITLEGQTPGPFTTSGAPINDMFSLNKNLLAGNYWVEVEFFRNDEKVARKESIVWIYGSATTASEIEVDLEGLQTKPSAPRNLLLSYSNGAVNLSWEDTSSSEDGFRIFGSTDGITFTFLSSVDPGVEEYTDTNLTPNSTKYYQVVAFNGAGESSAVSGEIDIPGGSDSGDLDINIFLADPTDLENILLGIKDVDNQAIVLSVGTSGVSTVTWKIDGVTVSTGNTLTLSPGDYTGMVLVSLQVTKDGRPYSSFGEVNFLEMPKTAAPSISPSSGTISPETDVTISGLGTVEYRYRYEDGAWEDWAVLANLPSLTEGSWDFEARATETGKLTSDVTAVSYTVEVQDGIQLYYYSTGSTPTIWAWVPNGGTEISKDMGYTWENQETMSSHEADWYVWDVPREYQAEVEADGLSFIFNAAGATHSRTQTGWFKNGSWTPDNPDTFPIIQVETRAGQYSEARSIAYSVEGYTEGLEVSVTVDGVPVASASPINVPQDKWDSGFQLSIVATTNQDSDSYTGSYSIGQNILSENPNSLRIYQIYVSSFIDTDGQGYNSGYGPNHYKGDFQGIIDAVPYIKSLGMNAIWLTPIFDAYSGIEAGQATGYYADDYFKVDPQFGTDADFRALVDAVHDAGMYILLDGVFGHTGSGPIPPSPNGYTPARGASQWYGYEVDYNQPQTLEYFREVATYWVEEYGIDGWRLDQAYQVPTWAWTEIRESVENLASARKTRGEEWGTLGYMVAEIWRGESEISSQAYGPEGNPALLSAFDFPSRYRLVQSLAGEESMSKYNQDAANIASSFDTHSAYPSHAIPNFFFTNHDVIRFGDLIQRAPHLQYGPENGDYWKRHKLAFAFTAAFTGPITIMYGDEHGVEAPNFINDGDNGYRDDNAARTSGKIANFTAAEQDLIDYVRELMNLRNTYESLWNGARTNLVASGNQYADLKTLGGEKVILAMNIGTSTTTINANGVGGNGLQDLQSGQTITGSGSYAINLEPLSARFLLVK